MTLMEQNRKIGVFGGIFLIIIFTGIIIDVSREDYPIFTWGLLVGIVFGLGTCIYLAEAWDPIGLQPTSSSTSKASWNLLWVVPLGALAANILSRFLGQEITYLLMGCIFAWLEITIGYFVIQAWRYRPK
ncbi:hypothetical protein MNBD_CHLOROFLEXI01-922 [hydrothermal vent metagenome]|uniref:Major facilitator superfamily (MFS) profile domain-containing protein n=1 Tax=hydrothermal vent metagenome TaxID=652676 RepID=A0A3B0VYE8_9ZZZZ